MKIKILTVWYNEEFLAPFFLKHYGYADEIYVLLDSDTNDGTRDILKKANNVKIEEFTFPDMMDDDIKANHINKAIKNIESDWIYVLDADEFIFPPNYESPQGFLSNVNGTVVMAKMWQVYRNRKDRDLDIARNSVVLQRRYGDENRETGINAAYCKPIILKTPINYNLSYGNHAIIDGKFKMANKHFDGAHWAMADPVFAINRRIKGRKERQSKHNLETGLTYQHHHITEKDLIAEFKAHENDPKLF